MPKALVTGATGFVGSNLTSYLLQQKWDVSCLVRGAERAKPLQDQGASLCLGDLANPEAIERAVEGTDFVFHIAGRVRALHRDEFEKDNVEGTRLVMEAADSQGEPPVVIYISSLAAGGPNHRQKPRKESDPDQPISDYGRSKLSAEQTASTYAARVPLSILRPPIIFGGGDQASLAIFRGVKMMRLHAVPGYGKLPVSLVHVLDLCNALVRIAERGERVKPSSWGNPPPGEGIYYIAAERTLDYGDLGRLAGKGMGYRAFAIPFPKGLFWLIGGVMEVVGQLRRKPSVLNLDKIREAVAPAWVCSDEKLRRQLGYQPAATLEERFEETANWYREHGWL